MFSPTLKRRMTPHYALIHNGWSACCRCPLRAARIRRGLQSVLGHLGSAGADSWFDSTEPSVFSLRSAGLGLGAAFGSTNQLSEPIIIGFPSRRMKHSRRLVKTKSRPTRKPCVARHHEGQSVWHAMARALAGLRLRSHPAGPSLSCL